MPGAVYKNTRSGRAELLRKSVEALGATPHPLRTYAGLVANCMAIADGVVFHAIDVLP